MHKLLSVVAILATIGVPAAAGARVAVAPNDPAAKVLRLTAQYDFFQNISDDPQSPTAPNPGDSTVEHGVLSLNGSRVGAVYDTCLFIVESQQLAAFGTMCRSSFVLGPNTIETSGVFTSIHAIQGSFVPDPYDEAITGGTGRYSDARGSVHIVFVANDVATFTVHLDG